MGNIMRKKVSNAVLTEMESGKFGLSLKRLRPSFGFHRDPEGKGRVTFQTF